MSPYRIELLNENGSVFEAWTRTFVLDDDAINHVARIDHPHEMIVWKADRLVAHFPAIGQRLD